MQNQKILHCPKCDTSYLWQEEFQELDVSSILCPVCQTGLIFKENPTQPIVGDPYDQIGVANENLGKRLAEMDFRVENEEHQEVSKKKQEEFFRTEGFYVPWVFRTKWLSDYRYLYLLTGIIFNFGIGHYTFYYLFGYYYDFPEIMSYASLGFNSNDWFGIGLLASIVRSLVLTPLLPLVIVFALKKFYGIPVDWFYTKPNSEKFRILFRSDQEFFAFREKVMNYSCRKQSHLLGVFFGLAYAGFSIYLVTTIVPNTDIPTSVIPAVYRVIMMVNTVNQFIIGFLITCLVFALIRIIKVVLLLGTESGIEFFPQSEKKESPLPKSTIYQYHSGMRVIGGFLFTFNFLIVLAGVVISLLFVIQSITLDVPLNPIVTWGISATLAFSVLFFVGIQFNIHKKLKDMLERTLENYNKALNENRLEIQNFVLSDETRNRGEGKISEVFQKIQFLDWEIGQIKGLGTWTYRFPKILSLVGGAAASFIPLIVDLVF